MIQQCTRRLEIDRTFCDQDKHTCTVGALGGEQCPVLPTIFVLKGHSHLRESFMACGAIRTLIVHLRQILLTAGYKGHRKA